MTSLLKSMWVLYLVGLVSCGSKSGQRRAVSTQVKETKDSTVYFVRTFNRIDPIMINEVEYKAMKALNMDSVTVQKYLTDDYFKLSNWKHEDYESENFLYVTVPFKNIIGQQIQVP